MKDLIVKSALKRLTDGDSGSTLLGILAAGLLSSNVNFGDLFSKDQTKKAQAVGLLIGTMAIVIWGYVTGKKGNNVSTTKD